MHRPLHCDLHGVPPEMRTGATLDAGGQIDGSVKEKNLHASRMTPALALGLPVSSSVRPGQEGRIALLVLPQHEAREPAAPGKD